MQQNPPSKIGLALSGGGARGLAHIGALKVLEQEGIPIDLLAGTSMGGVIAATYAAGLSPKFLEQEALRLAKAHNLLSLFDLSLPRQGLFEGQKIVSYLTKHLGERTFEDLSIPLRLIAVDLNNSQKVVLSEGRVVDAVRATIALPGIFRPVERGEQLLVDGGLLDNIPADVVRQMGADVVIAIDVMTGSNTLSALTRALQERRYLPGGLASTFEVMARSLDVMMTEINLRCLNKADPDVVIRPKIPPDMSVLLGFPRAADIIPLGEEAMREALPRIKMQRP